jgi:putative Mn2+ efflux pump MntP
MHLKDLSFASSRDNLTTGHGKGFDKGRITIRRNLCVMKYYVRSH